MLSESQISALVLLLGGITALVGAFATFRKGRGEALAAAAALEAAREDRKAETSKLIDEKVAGELNRLYDQLEEQRETIAALRTEVDELKASEGVTRRTNAAIKRAVQRWWDRLSQWDHAGRRGQIPLPSDEDARLLELEGALDISAAVAPVDPDIAV